MRPLLILLLTAMATYVVLTSCAPSTEVLIQEAHKCSAENGTDCWDEVNKRIEAERRREVERAKELKCDFGMVPYCDSRHKGTRMECVCVYVWGWYW